MPTSNDTDFTEVIAAEITPVSVTEYMDTDMATFAAYTIQDQALPAVADGMKPVHRRILYEMFSMGLSPSAKPVKSAKTSSATSGDFHPHGDASIYETMAGMTRAGERNPLIDGIGNFGYSTGDRPASARYTEARLSPAGWELVRELSRGNGGVHMVPSYDGEREEPVFLPVRYPALAISGATGMAHGWATKIPSHNPNEIIDLTVALVDRPDMPVADMLKLCPGPDFGEGCTVVGSREGVESYFETGRGSFTLRGTIEVTGKRTVVITEVPAGIAVSKDGGEKGLLGQIRDGIRSGVIEATDVSEYSDIEHPVRLEVTIRRGVDPEEVRRQILANTDAEIAFHANMSGLTTQGLPRVWSLKDMLIEFIDLRDELVCRRSQARAETLRGKLPGAKALAAVALDKEKAAELILAASNRQAAAEALSAHFGFEVEAAHTIVGLPMYRLTRADALEATAEVERLEKEIAELDLLVSSPQARKPVIIDELEETRKVFASATRRTRLAYGEATTHEMSSGQELAGLSRWRFADGMLSDTGQALTDDTVLWAVFDDGKVKLFTGSGLPKGVVPTPIAPNISRMVATGILPDGHQLAIVTRAGRVLRIKDGAINPQGVAGQGVAGVALDSEFDDAVVGAFPITDTGSILTVSGDGYKATKTSDIPAKGRGGRGVGLHALRKGDAGVMEAHYSPTGFLVGGKPLKPVTRAIASKRGSADWQVAEGTSPRMNKGKQ